MKSFLAPGWATQLALAQHKPQMKQVEINIKKIQEYMLASILLHVVVQVFTQLYNIE